MKLVSQKPVHFLFALAMAALLGSCKTEKKETENIIAESTEAPANWAERLGYPKGAKVLMLHSDDVGMCEEANQATEAYLDKGLIQSAAIMIPCPNAKAFVDWAIANPKQDIGLHLTLTSEWKTYRWSSVTPKDSVPGLHDPEGKMWRSVPEVVMNASPAELEKEVRAQIEQSIAWGYRPDHIDTHMGTLYGHPAFVEVFFRVAQEYGIPANAIDLSNAKVVEKFKGQGYPLTDEVVALANGYTLPKLDDFTSVPKGDTYEEKIQHFKDLVMGLDAGITEIIFHPSVETENLKTITNSWQQRSWEAQMFADPDLIAFFKEQNIIFTNWKEMMERHNK
jgi:predicted glycoside hydrolase/deacetylase ChbG (UPF0249 family)